MDARRILRQFEVLPAWSEDNEPGLTELLRGVNSFVGPNPAGYGRVLWEDVMGEAMMLILCQVPSNIPR